MIKTKNLDWVSIDEGDDSALPPPQYRRFIRVAILTKPISSVIRAGERNFWAFIDRQTSTFYVEEVIDPPGYLKVVEPQGLFDELWDHCRRLGLLNIIIPAEDPPLLHFDRATALEHAHKRYVDNRVQWQEEESNQE